MHITKEQLHHLAKLAKIEISAEQEQKYLKDLEGIIGFLETLEVSQTTAPLPKAKLKLFEGTAKNASAKELFKNTKHPLENGCISIQTSLKES